jgi:hypothetical protein
MSCYSHDIVGDIASLGQKTLYNSQDIMGRMTSKRLSSLHADLDAKETTSDLYKNKDPHGQTTSIRSHIFTSIPDLDSKYLPAPKSLKDSKDLIIPIYDAMAVQGRSMAIYAREGTKLSKILARIGMLLGLESDEREQFAQYPEETLLYTENKMASCKTVIMDRVRWFHAVCKEHSKRNNQGSNPPYTTRNGYAKYNRKGTTQSSSSVQNYGQVDDLPDSYPINRMCGKDDEVAIYSHATKTYYRKETVNKKDPKIAFERPAYEGLSSAFDRDTREQSPYFKSLRDLILSRAARGENLDVSVFTDEPTKAMAREVHEERVKTSEEIEGRLADIIDIIKENYKNKRNGMGPKN